MKPTVRFEFQLDRKKIKRTIGFRPSLSILLTKEFLIKKCWNSLLKERGLDKPIFNQTCLYGAAQRYLTPKYARTLRQMNENPTFNSKALRTDHLAVIRTLKAVNICPYSCEVHIQLTVNCYSTTTKNNPQEDLLCTVFFNPSYACIAIQDTIAEKWYLDSS